MASASSASASASSAPAPAPAPAPASASPSAASSASASPSAASSPSPESQPRAGVGPADRIDGYADLRSYAAIGDGRTVALIASDGAVDWFPTPNLRTPPVFAALLDADRGGTIQLRPTTAFTVSRAYVPGTNVLQTTFVTEFGSVRITDALVTGVAGRLPWSELARRIEGLTGSVDMRWCVAPGSAMNEASPWVEQTVHGAVMRVGNVMLGVRGLGHGPDEAGTQRVVGAFTTGEGSRHLIVLSVTDGEPLRMLTPELVDRGIDRTIKNWEFWSQEFSFDGPWAEAVHRSALALKLLIHSPTGAIVAAATTSLPESLSGGKNWDYRFAWVRDLAYTVNALIRFGLREETHAAVSWLLTTIRKHRPGLSVFYTLDGDRPTGIEFPDLPGWRNIGPVVVGNEAQGQLQLGIYGDLLGVVRAYVDDGNVLDAETGRMLAAVADRTCDTWHHRDSGMWELEDPQYWTASRLGCWQALDSAVHLSEMGQIPGAPDRWIAERDRISEWVHENCWSEERQSFVAYPGSNDLDTAVLLHAPSGFDRGERMSRTIDAIQAELGRGPLVYRYSGMEQEEGTFVACGFWLAAALACVGRMDEAKARVDELIALANDVGLYSEMMDAETHAFLGNLPQGLSHLALITAVLTIEELDVE